MTWNLIYENCVQVMKFVSAYYQWVDHWRDIVCIRAFYTVKRKLFSGLKTRRGKATLNSDRVFYYDWMLSILTVPLTSIVYNIDVNDTFKILNIPLYFISVTFFYFAPIQYSNFNPLNLCNTSLCDCLVFDHKLHNVGISYWWLFSYQFPKTQLSLIKSYVVIVKSCVTKKVPRLLIHDVGCGTPIHLTIIIFV